MTRATRKSFAGFSSQPDTFDRDTFDTGNSGGPQHTPTEARGCKISEALAAFGAGRVRKGMGEKGELCVWREDGFFLCFVSMLVFASFMSTTSLAPT